MAGELSDKTFLDKTGKSRKQWHAILDKFDCKKKGHKASAAHLYKDHGTTYWWAQTITIDYERANGIREVGQRSGGRFAVNVSRTIDVPVEDAWNAWADAKQVSKWFGMKHKQKFEESGTYSNTNGGKGVFKKIAPNDRIHFTRESEKRCADSLVIVQFLKKGASKTTVAVTHELMQSKKCADEMKEEWAWALTSLKSYLETGKPISHEDWKREGRKK